ncbi:ATP-binding cassette domain-containing protein [Alphaproteobacteria bacterium]|nr:ATP-binding cassette domain-containing protein [Alphaproteobacteria bacterium]
MTKERFNKSHWLWGLVLKQSGPIAKVVWLNVSNNLLQILISLFSMAVYNKVLPNYATTSLLTMSIGIGIIIIVDLCFKLIKSRIVQAAGDGVDEVLQTELFKKVLSWDLDSRPNYSGASSTLVKDIENIVELVTNNSVSTLVGIPFIALNMLVIYLIAGPVVIVVIIVCILTLAHSVYFYLRVSQLSPKNKDNQIEKTSIFLEALSNLETLKSIGNYDFFTKKWKETDKFSRELSSKTKNILADANTVNSVFQSLSQVAAVSVGAYFVIEGTVSAGALIAVVILNGKTIQPIIQLAGLLQRYSTAKVSFKKLNETFESVSKEEMRRQNISVPKVDGLIRIEKLSFKPVRANNSIINIRRVRIAKGQSVGIIGSIGSGKSTFLKLVAGVYTPTEGNVSFGSFDTTAINQTDLRRDVAYLGQSPGIFAGSIRDNLIIGKTDVSDEQISETIKLTGFDLVLRQLPNGLSFNLSENGMELSGGQRQILALTRAMLSDPTVLLLDEPTSAMDPKHEKLFIKQMKYFIENKTFLVVTHRRPILALTERLIMIEGGEVVLDGPRDEVLGKFK